MSEELGQLSGVYDIVVVGLSLNLILGSISNFAKYEYALAEMVKILEDTDGNLANVNTQKLNH
eukprot:snap_masked-scaffold_8-processed-gene-14.75-mRNA-1 protein AED:1.00 eAED:1.00 QI:0/0/0/0/1/1/2/0/62